MGEEGLESRRCARERLLLNHDVAEAFLQPLEGGDDLFARPIAARPQPELTASGTLQHRQLDPQLRDRCARLPLLDPRPDQAEKLCLAAQRMPDDRLTLLVLRGIESHSHAHLLCPGATQAQLVGGVAAQRAGDEEQRLAVLDRLAELAMRAGEQRRAPGPQLVWLEPACEQYRVTSLAAELALQLAWADGRDRVQRSQAEQVQSLQLLGVERKLARGERGEELSRIADLHQPAGTRARCRQSRRERARGPAEARLAADRPQASPPHLPGPFPPA